MKGDYVEGGGGITNSDTRDDYEEGEGITNSDTWDDYEEGVGITNSNTWNTDENEKMEDDKEDEDSDEEEDSEKEDDDDEGDDEEQEDGNEEDNGVASPYSKHNQSSTTVDDLNRFALTIGLPKMDGISQDSILMITDKFLTASRDAKQSTESVQCKCFSSNRYKPPLILCLVDIKIMLLIAMVRGKITSDMCFGVKRKGYIFLYK